MTRPSSSVPIFSLSCPRSALYVGIINNGLGSQCSCLARSWPGWEDAIIVTVADRQEEARLWLLEQQGIRDVTLANSGSLEVVFSGDRMAQAALLRELATRFTLFEFTPSKGNLEELFMEITEVAMDA